MPAARLTPDETEARANWWLSSMEYFDVHIGQAERVPHHLNHLNMIEVPLEFYRQFEEQKRHLKKQKRDIEEIRKKEVDHQETYEKVSNFIEDMNVEPGRQANKGSIIVSQHYGISDFSEFSTMVVPHHSKHNQTAAPSSISNILNPGKREQRPSIYKWSPYMEQPPSTDLPKKRGNKTKNNVKTSNLSPLNLGNALDDDNEGGDDVMFLGAQFTGNYLVYENVDVSKVR
nr:hypothetical protein [Tanacetum cinerariifolium]